MTMLGATPWAVIVAVGLAFVVGYALGAIPFGLLLTSARGIDIRNVGSGNIGATNVLRTGHKGLALATLLLDAGKGVLAVLLVTWFMQPSLAPAAGFGAVVGHMFPAWLNFRGGKAVATGAGVLLAAVWPVALICGAIWAAVAALLRISSVASLAATAAAPLATHFLGTTAQRDMAVAIAVLVFLAHRSNIRRLIAGTEPRFGETRQAK
jgi:glycerol-3-phosphate acyltransferase PlsY